MVRGLLKNAIDAGIVQIATGLSRQEDILLPRLAACPVGARRGVSGTGGKGAMLCRYNLWCIGLSFRGFATEGWMGMEN